MLAEWSTITGCLINNEPKGPSRAKNCMSTAWGLLPASWKPSWRSPLKRSKASQASAPPTFSGIRSRFVSNAAAQGIEVSMNETEGIDIDAYRRALRQAHPAVAADVRQAVADAVVTQVGFKVSSVDVYSTA